MTNTNCGYLLPSPLLASTLWKVATVPIFLSCHFLLALIKKYGPGQGDLLRSPQLLCSKTVTVSVSTGSCPSVLIGSPNQRLWPTSPIYLALPHFVTRKFFLPPNLNGPCYRVHPIISCPSRENRSALLGLQLSVRTERPCPLSSCTSFICSSELTFAREVTITSALSWPGSPLLCLSPPQPVNAFL